MNTDVQPLTTKQSVILETIRAAVRRDGFPPSVREIGAAVGLVSPSSVAYQLGELERKGWLRRVPDRPRAIVVLDPDLHRLCPNCQGSGRLPDVIEVAG